MRKILLLILISTPLLAEDFRISEEELNRLDELMNSLETQLNEQLTEINNLNSELQEQESEISRLKTLSTKQKESLLQSEQELRQTKIIAGIELAIIIGFLITFALR